MPSITLDQDELLELLICIANKLAVYKGIEIKTGSEQAKKDYEYLFALNRKIEDFYQIGMKDAEDQDEDFVDDPYTLKKQRVTLEDF